MFTANVCNYTRIHLRKEKFTIGGVNRTYQQSIVKIITFDKVEFERLYKVNHSFMIAIITFLDSLN